VELPHVPDSSPARHGAQANGSHWRPVTSVQGNTDWRPKSATPHTISPHLLFPKGALCALNGARLCNLGRGYQMGPAHAVVEALLGMARASSALARALLDRRDVYSGRHCDWNVTGLFSAASYRSVSVRA